MAPVDRLGQQQPDQMQSPRVPGSSRELLPAALSSPTRGTSRLAQVMSANDNDSLDMSRSPLKLDYNNHRDRHEYQYNPQQQQQQQQQHDHHQRKQQYNQQQHEQQQQALMSIASGSFTANLSSGTTVVNTQQSADTEMPALTSSDSLSGDDDEMDASAMQASSESIADDDANNAQDAQNTDANNDNVEPRHFPIMKQSSSQLDLMANNETSAPFPTNYDLTAVRVSPPKQYSNRFENNQRAGDETTDMSPIKMPLRSSPMRSVLQSSPFVFARLSERRSELFGDAIEADHNADVDPAKMENQEHLGQNLDNANDGNDYMQQPASPLLAPRALTTANPRHVIMVDDKDDGDDDIEEDDDAVQNNTPSASELSSPIRPMVRKSSLTFATLPAREPMTTTKKSVGGSRLSHNTNSTFDQTRFSQYSGRATGGKSIGRVAAAYEADQMELNHDAVVDDHNSRLDVTGAHKSMPSTTPASVSAVVHRQQAVQYSSPVRSHAMPGTPGAFPADDDQDDDWLGPKTFTPSAATTSGGTHASKQSQAQTAVADKITRDALSSFKFAQHLERAAVPQGAHEQQSAQVQRPTTPPRPDQQQHQSQTLPAVDETQSARPSTPGTPIIQSWTPALSPTRSPVRNPPRESPLKHVKNKISSFIKGSKGLLTSNTAAAPAPGGSDRNSLFGSPSQSRLNLRNIPSTESLVFTPTFSSQATMATTATTTSTAKLVHQHSSSSDLIMSKEDKRKDKEAKRHAEQVEKLEKVREKERQRVRACAVAEQEKRVPMSPRKMTARPEAQNVHRPKMGNSSNGDEGEREETEGKEQDGDGDHVMIGATASTISQASQSTTATYTTAPLAVTISGDPSVESSNHDNNPAMDQGADVEDGHNGHDDSDDGDIRIDKDEVSAGATAPSPEQAPRTRGVKRPMKPSQEPISRKLKLAPTVIRVNTTSLQHPHFAPQSTSSLAANLHETLAPASVQTTPQVGGRQVSRPVTSTLRNKTSAQNLKTSVNGRPKALELAAKKRVAEEEANQRRREQKLEIERKRAALQEEQRRDAQEKRLAEQQQKQRERQEAEKQAAIEKAKRTRPPPPVARLHPNGPPDYGLGGAGGMPTASMSTSATSQREMPRPPSRIGTLHRPQDESTNRPVNRVLSKPAHKRTMTHDDMSAQSRGGPAFQGKDAKRRRTSNEYENNEHESAEALPTIHRPPVRPSSVLKRDMSSKASFTQAPPSRDLFKNSLKPGGHALDMSAMSKGPIPFAPSNPAVHKTPARVATLNAAHKAALKSGGAHPSPKFPHGDAIELPEIQTDDDDDDDSDNERAGAGGGKNGVAEWADSPRLRDALMQQQTVDPYAIFGPPAPLIMEEVFSKSKERWSKFRARTSSANWSGADRLTEEEIRRDLQARDKIRREGGWSYDMSKDL